MYPDTTSTDETQPDQPTADPDNLGALEYSDVATAHEDDNLPAHEGPPAESSFPEAEDAPDGDELAADERAAAAEAAEVDRTHLPEAEEV